MNALSTLFSFSGNCAPAPVKTERIGKWAEVIIPIDDDNVCYLTVNDDAIAAIVAVMRAKHFPESIIAEMQNHLDNLNS